jgi:two-component system response regulator (stage 0 sporulation protein A)
MLTFISTLINLICFLEGQEMQNAINILRADDNLYEKNLTDKITNYDNFLDNLSRDELYIMVKKMLGEQPSAVEIIKNFFGKTDKTEKINTEKPSAQTNDIELNRRISNIFITIGIPPHIKGYQYLRCAIRICIQKTEIISCITKCLYPDVAKEFSTTPTKVERAIRHAIEVCWNRGKIDVINNFFGSTIFTKYDRPTNGEFIALIADKLLLEGV